MTLQLCNVGHPQSVARVVSKQLVDEVDGDWVEVSWVIDVSVHNICKYQTRIFAVEWGLARQKLVDDASQSPEVSSLPRLIVLQHFRSSIQGSANKGPQMLSSGFQSGPVLVFSEERGKRSVALAFRGLSSIHAEDQAVSSLNLGFLFLGFPKINLKLIR